MTGYITRQGAAKVQGRSAQVASSGLFPTVERLASGARAAARSRTRSLSAGEAPIYTPPVPTFFRNEPGELTGTFPHPGRWEARVDLKVIFPTAVTPPLRAEVTARFSDPMSGVGPTGEGWVPSFSDDDLGALTDNRPWQLLSPVFVYDLADDANPSFDLAFSLYSNAGDYGAAVVTPEVTLSALCVWGTPA